MSSEISIRKRKRYVDGESFLLFRFMRISGKEGNYELFIRLRGQISPLILREFKRIN